MSSELIIDNENMDQCCDSNNFAFFLDAISKISDEMKRRSAQGKICRKITVSIEFEDSDSSNFKQARDKIMEIITQFMQFELVETKYYILRNKFSYEYKLLRETYPSLYDPGSDETYDTKTISRILTECDLDISITKIDMGSNGNILYKVFFNKSLKYVLENDYFNKFITEIWYGGNVYTKEQFAEKMNYVKN